MRKKILLINSYYYPDIVGGAEVSVKLLAEDLYSSGYDVTVITTSTNDKVDFVNGIKVIRIKHRNLYWLKESKGVSNWKKTLWHLIAMFGWNNRKILKKLILEEKPVVVLSQNLLGIGTYHWGILRKLGIPSILTLRDYALINPTPINLLNKIAKMILKQRIKNIDVVVGVSRFILNDFLRVLPNLKNLDNKVIYNKINSSIIKEIKQPHEKCSSNNTLEKKITIGFVGQINRNKGLEELLKAVLNEKNNQLEYFVKKVKIVGDGTEKNKLENKYQDIKGIEFLGKLAYDSTVNTIDSIDILVVPSKWDEPFGRVVIEGYARGKIVLASKKGGIPEIIIDEEHLFEPNPDDIKDKIKNIYNNKVKFSERDLINYSMQFKENVEYYKEIIENLSN